MPTPLTSGHSPLESSPEPDVNDELVTYSSRDPALGNYAYDIAHAAIRDGRWYVGNLVDANQTSEVTMPKVVGKCRACGWNIMESTNTPLVVHPTNPRYKYHRTCCQKRMKADGSGFEWFHPSWKMSDHLGNTFVPNKAGMASYRLRRKAGQSVSERRFVDIKTMLKLKKLGVIKRGQVLMYPEGWTSGDVDFFGARSSDLRFINSDGKKSSDPNPDPRGFEYVGAELEVERGDLFKRQLLTKAERGRIFGAVSDGSIDGVEVLTIPSAGPQLIKTMNIVGKALDGMSWAGTDACGAHQHVNFKNRNSNDHIKNAMLLCHKFEPFIHNRIDSDRVGNDYCRSITSEWSRARIENTPAEHIDRLYYGREDCAYSKSTKYTSERYYGANLHSIWFRGTLEFRYLEGTVDFKRLSSFGLLYASLIETVNTLSITEFQNLWRKHKNESPEVWLSKRMNTPSLRLLKRFNPSFIK